MSYKIPDSWFHGTHPSTAGFNAWQMPPPLAPNKNHPDLYLHKHCYLTDDIVTARAVCDKAEICYASIQPEAKVLNTLDPMQSESLRLKLRQDGIGKIHDATQSHDIWMQSCKSGVVMKFGSSHPHARIARDAKKHWALFKETTQPAIYAPKSMLFLQNLTRQWIEEISDGAEALGYDALIIRELNSQLGVSPLILVALNPQALTPPTWL